MQIQELNIESNNIKIYAGYIQPKEVKGVLVWFMVLENIQGAILKM